MSQAETEALCLVKHCSPSRYVLFPNSQTLSTQVWASLSTQRQTLSIVSYKKRVHDWNLKTICLAGGSRVLHIGEHYLNFVEQTLEFKLYPQIQCLMYNNNHW